MALTRFGVCLFGLALALLASPSAQASTAAPGDPVVTLDKPLYQTGETATLTVTGTPGDQLWLLFDRRPGPTVLPGLGTFGLQMGRTLGVFPMGPMPASGSLTVAYTPDCLSAVVGEPTFLQAVTSARQAPLPVHLSNVAVYEVQRGDECHNCPKTPIQDPTFGASPGGTAVYLHGIGNDFVFAPGASFAEYSDGTARLTGEIFRPTVPTERFLLDTLFTSYMGAGDVAYPPVGSPKLELAPAAYADQGGPIYPNVWHYYPTFTGLLIGLDDFAGGIVSIARTGPAFQVGYGANGKDLTYGGSGWLNVAVLTQPTSTTLNSTGGGDINMSVGDCPALSTPLCPTAAAPDAFSPQQSLAPHAVVMFSIDGKYDFNGPNDSFTEFSDGTARLQGELVNTTDGTKKWTLDVIFNGKIDVGDPLNPPPGSPKLELMSSAYIWNNGPIDPATWHYYTNFSGTLVGSDAFDGAELLVTMKGGAFQVGAGANGKNIQYGASAWTWFDVIQQPAQGPALPVHTDGDININLVNCPTAP